ncbi:choice-of-anchor I family protein [Gracilibacillus sp. YIM 98692]|uniref:choice-of-anchor I family protein n=1 Tax=Gracilibacillus sp. YIM 98692 TaxID=2663532 RepID=UPI0013D62C33|nr:choice-of-anchor I family protein [Gracilibacillus sp. YIM 98692]
MSRIIYVFIMLCFFLFSNPTMTLASEEMTYYTTNEISLSVEFAGRFDSQTPIDEGGTEIVAYDSNTYHAFSVNGADQTLDILDLSGLENGNEKIPLVEKIHLSDFGVDAGDLTSVAIHPDGGYIAATIPAPIKIEAGSVVLMTTEGEVITSILVGALPDMVTFTPDGNKILVANEGEPNEDYTVNPEGSVSIIDVSNGVGEGTSLTAKKVSFAEDILEDNIRKVHAESTHPEDLEPEYIVIDDNSQFAYVALQESNAIAKLDIEKEEFTKVKNLGYKDFSKKQNKLDASNDDDEINIRNWPVLSPYQPDGMKFIHIEGQDYILTANEGDAQDWDGFSEETGVEDLASEDKYDLNADLFDGYTQEELDQLIENGLFDEDQLGALGTSTSHPVTEEGKYEAVYSYGGRSFSIWNADTLEQVYDSGSEFEELMASFEPTYFNSDNDADTFDSRSDNKGVEPESVTTGHVNGTDYAFIGLERQGGIMVYNLSDPLNPSFDSYFSSRVFTDLDTDVTKESGDVAPEGLTFVNADQSPTSKPLLLVAHEVSGTIATYELGESSDLNNAADDQSTTEKEGVKDTPENSTEENELPNTATTLFNWMLAGFVIIVIGMVLYVLYGKKSAALTKKK